jgi:hypothetical protein
MSLIKIIANSIELDFVKETLSIKKENNALNRDFKVSYSSIPFLIIENSNSKKALGTRDLSSVKKLKTIEVVVFEGGKKYSGELQILSYLNGFRKCNLKYASSLLSIMNRKISEFMPVVSVIPGETNPIPFTEETTNALSGVSNWKTYPATFLQSGFPSVKWQFPQLSWDNKFGKKLDVSDEWFNYQGSINKYTDLDWDLVENNYTEDQNQILEVFNKNVPSPQIYLLSPLFYALNSIGFTATGAFYTNEFINRLLLLSTKNNLSKTALSKFLANIVFYGGWTSGPIGQGFYSKYKREQLNLATKGDYVITYSLTFAGPVTKIDPGLYSLKYYLPTSGTKTIFVIKEITESTYTISGSVTFSIEEAQTLQVYLWSNTTVMPTSYTIAINNNFNKDYFQMHPTIETGRYLPDWTFVTYLNALQNTFNLEINIDDFAKKMNIDFNEETILSGANTVLKKSLAVTGYEQPPFDAFLLKYDNDQDLALWITKQGVSNFGTQTSNFSQTLNNKFKLVPNTYTSNLSEELDSKSGVGLMLYDHAAVPFTTDNYLDQTLSMDGPKGIYEVFWKKIVRILMNGSKVEMSGPFTETELNKILALNRIYIDNQEYIISFTESTETDQDNYLVKFSLVSITF